MVHSNSVSWHLAVLELGTAIKCLNLDYNIKALAMLDNDMMTFIRHYPLVVPIPFS